MLTAKSNLSNNLGPQFSSSISARSIKHLKQHKKETDSGYGKNSLGHINIIAPGLVFFILNVSLCANVLCGLTACHGLSHEFTCLQQYLWSINGSKTNIKHDNIYLFPFLKCCPLTNVTRESLGQPEGETGSCHAGWSRYVFQNTVRLQEDVKIKKSILNSKLRNKLLCNNSIFLNHSNWNSGPGHPLNKKLYNLSKL